jgi:hypothetical protein
VALAALLCHCLGRFQLCSKKSLTNTSRLASASNTKTSCVSAPLHLLASTFDYGAFQGQQIAFNNHHSTKQEKRIIQFVLSEYPAIMQKIWVRKQGK